jgi:tryptophanyl-tRNA synthetase
MMKKIALTGIKPTGTPHLGNYLGMIKPALELVDDYQALYFIADYHALITVKHRRELERQVYEVAATWLALGLDPGKVIFFRQSDIPEVFELAWILSCFTAKGLLNRAHAYKAAVAANVESRCNPDTDVNSGLFSYPVLMAADILLFGSRIVPVGSDQKQHVEITRDIAAMVNQTCGRVFVLPEPLIRSEVMTIPGLDGRKMSKTYGNTIPIFAEPDLLRKRVMGIVTDSRSLEEPKNPDDCTVFKLYRHFASPESIETIRRGYTSGGLAYSVVKQKLLHVLEEKIGPLRAAYRNYLKTPDRIDRTLSTGATAARKIAAPILEKVRRKIGIRR